MNLLTYSKTCVLGLSEFLVDKVFFFLWKCFHYVTVKEEQLSTISTPKQRLYVVFDLFKTKTISALNVIS